MDMAILIIRFDVREVALACHSHSFLGDNNPPFGATIPCNQISSNATKLRQMSRIARNQSAIFYPSQSFGQTFIVDRRPCSALDDDLDFFGKLPAKFPPHEFEGGHKTTIDDHRSVVALEFPQAEMRRLR